MILRIGCPVIRVDLNSELEVGRHVKVHDCRGEGVMTPFNTYVVFRHLIHVGNWGGAIAGLVRGIYGPTMETCLSIWGFCPSC